MTPAERRAWQLLQRRARDLSPDLITAILRAYALLRADLSVEDVARLIAAGRLDEAVNAALPADLIERALVPATTVLTDGTFRTARATMKALPPKARTIAIAFDTLDPRVIEAVRNLGTTSIQSLAPEIRQAVRQHIEAGITAGVNPRTSARALREVIGLAPNQEEAVRNFRAKLEGGPRSAVAGDVLPHRNAQGKLVGGSQLRNKRFDDVIRRAIRDGEKLSPEQIDRMTDAYRRKMVAFNAETHARTAALEAQKLGQRLAWQEAQASGALGDANVWKRWVATMDDRVRDEHAAMNGEERPLDQPYSSGQMYPGEGEWNCRCVETYFVKQPSFALAA